MAYMTPSCFTPSKITTAIQPEVKPVLSLREQFLLWIENVRRVDILFATKTPA